MKISRVIVDAVFHREFPIITTRGGLLLGHSAARVTQRSVRRARLTTTMKMFRAPRYRAPPRAASHIYHYYRYRMLHCIYYRN
jgi:hypothetical protein